MDDEVCEVIRQLPFERTRYSRLSAFRKPLENGPALMVRLSVAISAAAQLDWLGARESRNYVRPGSPGRCVRPPPNTTRVRTRQDVAQRFPWLARPKRASKCDAEILTNCRMSSSFSEWLDTPLSENYPLAAIPTMLDFDLVVSTRVRM
jgi:hypothetical protein